MRILSEGRDEEAKLQAEFDAAMIELYRRARVEATYYSSHFLRMLSEHRGLKTTQILLRPQKENADFTTLWARKRLDLTMEEFSTQISKAGIRAACWVTEGAPPKARE